MPMPCPAVPAREPEDTPEVIFTRIVALRDVKRAAAERDNVVWSRSVTCRCGKTHTITIKNGE